MRNLLVAAMIVMMGASAHAMSPVEVDDVRFARASLTVSAPTGETSYSPAELEALGTYAFTTKTPWRDAPAEFVGIRLIDLLAANGMSDVKAIRVVAENDYAVTIERAAWTKHDMLVATRVNGKPHSRRARGPIQFVFPMSTDPATGEADFEANWVWMAARIEIIN